MLKYLTWVLCVGFSQRMCIAWATCGDRTRWRAARQHDEWHVIGWIEEATGWKTTRCDELKDYMTCWKTTRRDEGLKNNTTSWHVTGLIDETTSWRAVRRVEARPRQDNTGNSRDEFTVRRDVHFVQELTP